MKNFRFFILALLVLSAAGCGAHRKLAQMKAGDVQARLSLPAENASAPLELRLPEAVRDTLRVVDLDGHEMLLMNAVRDEDGEMVATDRLSAAVVTARFRNVAERGGSIELAFEVMVPREMQDSRWQLRLDPDMFFLEDSLRLDPVIITGRDYRRAQLRGYQQYQRFLDSIVTDSTRFINKAALELFLERNLPQVFAFRADSSYVSDEQFASAYGVTEQKAVEHYTYLLLKQLNTRRAGMREAMFRHYVKSPIVSEGIRLDTVVTSASGDFIYNYVQTVNTRPRLRKIDIVLSGEILEQDKRVYSIPRSEPLTFYISSISGLADGRERFLRRIVSRKVEANTACYIEFPLGRANVNPDLGHNPEEIARIKGNIRELLLNETFDLDSICVEAYASPEGAFRANDALAARRALAASEYFSDYAAMLRDSLAAEAGVMLTLGGASAERAGEPSISFCSRSGGENWRMLDRLVEEDDVLSRQTKDFYLSTASVADRDARERALSRHRDYRYMREHLYPRLRLVKFNFYLHRKGMVRDTLITSEPDTAYMRGVKCLQEHDYEEALKILWPYRDYNTAVACVALDRNATAEEILAQLPESAGGDYLMAIIRAREGDERSAAEHYIHACAREPSYVHRGNLDPEISALIRKYQLNNE